VSSYSFISYNPNYSLCFAFVEKKEKEKEKEKPCFQTVTFRPLRSPAAYECRVLSFTPLQPQHVETHTHKHQPALNPTFHHQTRTRFSQTRGLLHLTNPGHSAKNHHHSQPQQLAVPLGLLRLAHQAKPRCDSLRYPREPGG
jgi:hypothetical protein